MALITFEDLPSTETPLTADNLNNNFEYLNDVVFSLANAGNVKIGKLAIEWGTVDVTSGADPTTTSPYNIYSGSVTLNFSNTYTKKPIIITQIANSYYNCLATYYSNSQTTSCNVGMRISSANSTRTLAYLVIGTIE